MRLFRTALVCFAILSVCRGIEIDPTEQPLVRIRFPLTDTLGNGQHVEIVYVLLKSGIGYSVLSEWRETKGGFRSGSDRNRKTFWLGPSEIETLIEIARSFPRLESTIPPSQQIVIEETGIEGGRLVSSWRAPGARTLPLLFFLGGLREELEKHFAGEPRKPTDGK